MNRRNCGTKRGWATRKLGCRKRRTGGGIPLGTAHRRPLLVEPELFGVDQRPQDVLIGCLPACDRVSRVLGELLLDVFERGFLVRGGGLAAEDPEEELVYLLRVGALVIRLRE